LFLGGIPLWLRKVPPNPLYGYRTEYSMSSPDVWFRVNETLGLVLTFSGGAALATCLFLYFQIGPNQQWYRISTYCSIAASVISLVSTAIFAK
jgi:hypothetical protein